MQLVITDFDSLERYAARLHAAFEVHQCLGALPVTAFAPRLTTLEENLAKARALPADAPQASRTELVGRIRSEIEELEPALCHADSTVSMASFRYLFDERKLPLDVLVSYSQLLADHIDESPERRERVDFLVTRLITARDGGGPVLGSRADAEPVVSAFSKERATEGVRKNATSYFARVAARVADASTLDELFESGLLLEVAGFKRDLGADHLDPDVLYSSAGLNVAIMRKLEEVVERHKLPTSELGVRFSKLEAAIRATFPAVEKPTPEPEKASPRRPAEKAPAARTPPARRPGGRSALPRAGIRVMGVVLLLAGGTSVAREAYLRRDPLESMPSGSLAAISGQLTSGSLAGDGTMRVFIGRVGSTWNVLGAKDRRAEAERMRTGLSKLGVYGGLVLDREGEKVVVQIDRGQVLAVADEGSS